MSGGSLTITPDFVNTVLSNAQNIPLFFQVAWTDSTSSGYSYSLPWAIADQSDASQILSTWPSLVTSGEPAYTQGTSPTVTTGALSSTTGTDSSSLSSSTATAASSSGSAGSSGKGKSGGLSTGAIVGIAVGIAAALVIISLIAGCFCLRRRRRNNTRGGDGNPGAHAMQDMVAEKEARVGVLEGEQPDTPSECAPPNRLGHRPGPGPTGHAVSGGDAIVPCDGYYTIGNDRNSGAYDPDVRFGPGSSTARGTPTPGSSSNSSPTHTHPPSYVHEGVDHVRQGHFDENAARGTAPDENQPISPDSAGGMPRMRDPALGSRSATPSGISGRYAHLIEEGMTVSKHPTAKAVLSVSFRCCSGSHDMFSLSFLSLVF